MNKQQQEQQEFNKYHYNLFFQGLELITQCIDKLVKDNKKLDDKLAKNNKRGITKGRKALQR